MVDRVSMDRHPLSKMAKDYGSAAVHLSLLLCLGVWVAAVDTPHADEDRVYLLSVAPGMPTGG